jgi:SAM-dependent methyltransferase
MTTIADSNAVFLKDRVLAQHQAALTLLQSRLANPARTPVRWLDIACGRGQMLASLDSNLSEKARGKLQYFGFDVSSEFIRHARQQAESLGLSCVDAKVGDLSDFGTLLPVDSTYDFITFTNSAHEVTPSSLAAVLVDAVLRLAPGGTLFVYDMETITPPELGAIPWRRDEFKSIIGAMLSALGAWPEYEPALGTWLHRTTSGWNAQIQREFIGTGDLAGKRESAVSDTSAALERTMIEKLRSCRDALDKLTRYGAETEKERDDQMRLLFEFWSLSRALKVGP